ncbi:serine hydrolase domain-containing protein [Legionella brunensis]|uniref:Putative secreted esterase n=1 Tax=Legionella brunensis TaxID=29422 RepID=A0A0W0S1G8_9GAMM|nr:serine hydrolase domain-containing protein [Legionella brunensis]KTC76957.1 putative secreted esterase [Legionella brunensis]
MSYTKMEELFPKKEISLIETMEKAQIPGVSIAYLDQEGVISTREEGVTDGCGLFKMANDPTQCAFDKLGLGTKNAVVLFNDELYYVVQKEEKVHKITKNLDNEADYQKLKSRCTDTYQLADKNDYPLLNSLTGEAPPTKVQKNTIFGAASLSKPVFSNLVQRLIEKNSEKTAEPGVGKFILPKEVTHFDLDTPLSSILPLQDFKIDEIPAFDTADESAVSYANDLTTRMVLSHMTGLAHGEIKFQFNPAEKAHGYSNVAILYLQKVIETLTQSNIEALAQKHVFGPCGMLSSSFGIGRVLLSQKEPLLEEMKPSELVILQKDGQLTAYWLENSKLVTRTLSESAIKEIVKMLPKDSPISENPDLIHAVVSAYGCPQLKPKAINSLRTTAKDYASFVKYLMNNKPLEDPFVPQVFMTEDKGRAGLIGVAKGNIPDSDLTHVAWGLGWGLQTEGKKATTAYHSGDMNDCRAWVAINLNDKTAVVYFANSHNGHILADQIIPKSIALDHAANYFFHKWGFARNFEELGGVYTLWGINPSLKPPATSESMQHPLDNDKTIENPLETEEPSTQSDTHKKSMNPFQTTLTPDDSKWT